jgi:chitin disaccharide deacetylase
MKVLIVNGDDFGASRGVNAGVVEAHVGGVLTSTSMMVDAHASVEAARLAEEYPDLGVGVHVVLDQASANGDVEAEVERQLERFVTLMGRAPTHLDSHQNVHEAPRVLPAFVALAERYGLPLRGHCGVRHIGAFYGQWNGETHLEQIGREVLARILASEVIDGLNELCCHPGYADETLR